MTNRTLHETGNDAKKGFKQSTIVRVIKKLVLEPQPVTPVIVMTKAKVLLHLDPDYKLATQGYLTAKDTVEDLSTRFFFILVTNKRTRPQKVYRHKVSRRPNDDICKIINAEKQTSEDKSSPSSIINIVGTEKLSSAIRLEDKNTEDWPDSISIPYEYASYRDEFVNMLVPFASMWDGHLGIISTV